MLYSTVYYIVCAAHYTGTSSHKPRHSKENPMTLDLRTTLDSTDLSLQERTGLVRIRRGVDSSLFGGWGVRI
jgi:hypothetical protein